MNSSGPEPSDASGPSRRSFVLGALAGSAAIAPLGWPGGAWATTADFAPASGGHPAAGLPTVQPLAANHVATSVGMNAWATQMTTGYKYTSQVAAAMAATGAGYFRSAYGAGLPSTLQLVSDCRKLDLMWAMSVANLTSYTVSDVVATIKHIAAHAPDRCLYIEGANEPNTKSNPRWVSDTLKKQQAIWQTVKGDHRLAHVKVVGPSLNTLIAKPTDYQALARGGLLKWVDYTGLHRYPNGYYPSFQLDATLRLVRQYWPGKPIWITETGYNNAMKTRMRHNPVPESVAAQYAPASILEHADRGLPVAWFQTLDAPDPKFLNVNDHFGFYACVNNSLGPNWRPKPIVGAVRSFLGSLADPGPAFTPRRVGFKVTSNTGDVVATLTAKRNGAVTAHLRRQTDCWDANRRVPIRVAKANVTIQTATYKKSLQVDHRVTSILL